MKYFLWCTIFLFSKSAIGLGSSHLHSGFIENKGQVIDQNGIHQSNVLFIFQSDDYNIILKENGFSYTQYRIIEKSFLSESDATNIKSIAETDVTLHRIDIRFIGATTPLIIKENKSPYNFNYQNIQPAVNQVSSFSKITYKNIYKNIDLVFYAMDGKVKYDFILHPDAVLKDIQMQYEGAGNPELKADGSIDIKTHDRVLNEKIPLSYLLNKSEDVTITYEIKDNVVSFKSSGYDKRQTLVIDPYPTITWNTIFEHVNYYLSSTIDTHNNKILSAFCFANNIATTGAYQTTLQGFTDAVIAKFDPDGLLQWATYYGGNKAESPYSVCSDNSDNIILTGTTSSTSNISTPGSYKHLLTGVRSAFIAKFNSDGIRTWGTYYGGSTGETPYSVCSDLNNNILIIGQVGSTDFDFATPGAFQTTPALTFIAKFTPSGSREWGTYYGGPLTNGYKVACSKDGSVYISGEMADANFATAGTHQQQPAGFYDAFLAKFSSEGNRIWSTYFGGEGKEKMSYDQCLSFDHSGNIILTGRTNSVTKIATSSAFKKTVSGNDAFIAKFNDAGILNWATYFGDAGDDVGHSVCVDSDDNIIIGGSTNSTTNISTPCVFQPNIKTSNNNAPASNYNFFIAKFDSTGNRIWGSYYGDNSFAQCAVELDRSNKIILTGFTRTSPKDTILDGNTVFPLSGNAFITRFDETIQPGKEITILGTNPFCQGNSIILSASTADKYLWSNGETTQSIVAIHEGKYFLTLADANGCSVNSDSVDLHYIRPSILLNGPVRFCSGGKIELTATKGLSYKWSTQETSQSITVNRAGNYFVTVMDTSNTCISTSTILHIDEIFPPAISLEPKYDTICMGEEIQKSIAVSGATFAWSTGSVSNSITISSSGHYWVEVTRSPCATVKDSFDVVMIPGIYYEIPNLVTPNGDDKNDTFEIVHLLPNTSLSIYNSWGSLVYKDDNYKNNWGAPDVTNGIFYYHISNPSICVKEYSGWLEIKK